MFDGMSEVEMGLEPQVSKHTVHGNMRTLFLKFDAHKKTDLMVAIFREILRHRSGSA
jgi:DNA-binding NarL/FixJ family response regulator